jgi:hypothetical protein
MPRSEPAPDKIGKHTNGEPVIEQSRSGAASLPCGGKQFERAPLARAELAFFMQSAHRIALRRDPASARQMIRVSCFVQGWVGILRFLGKRPASTYDFFVKLVDKSTDNDAPLVLCKVLFGKDRSRSRQWS